ncbi:MAG: GDSL-type esterase/lipase family protein [Bacilli bacterium]|jgi:lysophospholipase L1-like esterase|nr:GDSL-type esterase/lipase family protein [Bacilli bacterium]
MKNILCFGDSNTYGLIADGSGRYDEKIRFPMVLQSLLGSNYHIIEEGCPGRTTIFKDPTRPYLKATEYLFPCLYSHMPLDLIIVMLGTNDCKTIFNANAKKISDGLKQVINLIKEYTFNEVDILIVSPPCLGDKIYLDEYDPDYSDIKNLETAKELPLYYEKLAQEENCYFLNASKYVVVSEIDQEHMDKDNHYILAKELFQKVKEIIG